MQNPEAEVFPFAYHCYKNHDFSKAFHISSLIKIFLLLNHSFEYQNRISTSHDVFTSPPFYSPYCLSSCSFLITSKPFVKSFTSSIKISGSSVEVMVSIAGLSSANKKLQRVQLKTECCRCL